MPEDSSRITITELAQETNFSREEIRVVVKKLAAEKKIKARKYSYGKGSNQRYEFSPDEAETIRGAFRQKEANSQLNELFGSADAAREFQKRTRGKRDDNSATGITMRMYRNCKAAKSYLVQQKRTLEDSNYDGSEGLRETVLGLIKDSLQMVEDNFKEADVDE